VEEGREVNWNRMGRGLSRVRAFGMGRGLGRGKALGMGRGRGGFGRGRPEGDEGRP